MRRNQWSSLPDLRFSPDSGCFAGQDALYHSRNWQISEAPDVQLYAFRNRDNTWDVQAVAKVESERPNRPNVHKTLLSVDVPEEAALQELFLHEVQSNEIALFKGDIDIITHSEIEDIVLGLLPPEDLTVEDNLKDIADTLPWPAFITSARRITLSAFDNDDMLVSEESLLAEEEQAVGIKVPTQNEIEVEKILDPQAELYDTEGYDLKTNQFCYEQKVVPWLIGYEDFPLRKRTLFKGLPAKVKKHLRQTIDSLKRPTQFLWQQQFECDTFIKKGVTVKKTENSFIKAPYAHRCQKRKRAAQINEMTYVDDVISYNLIATDEDTSAFTLLNLKEDGHTPLMQQMLRIMQNFEDVFITPYNDLDERYKAVAGRDPFHYSRWKPLAPHMDKNLKQRP